MAEDVLRENKINVEILVAGSGEEALEIIKKTKIDVMLLDIIMPGLNGMDVLVELKKTWIWQTTQSNNVHFIIGQIIYAGLFFAGSGRLYWQAN